MQENFDKPSFRGPESNILHSKYELKKIQICIDCKKRAPYLNPDHIMVVRRPGEGSRPLFSDDKLTIQHIHGEDNDIMTIADDRDKGRGNSNGEHMLCFSSAQISSSTNTSPSNSDEGFFSSSLEKLSSIPLPPSPSLISHTVVPSSSLPSTSYSFNSSPQRNCDFIPQDLKHKSRHDHKRKHGSSTSRSRSRSRNRSYKSRSVSQTSDHMHVRILRKSKSRTSDRSVNRSRRHRSDKYSASSKHRSHASSRTSRRRWRSSRSNERRVSRRSSSRSRRRRSSSRERRYHSSRSSRRYSGSRSSRDRHRDYSRDRFRIMHDHDREQQSQLSYRIQNLREQQPFMRGPAVSAPFIPIARPLFFPPPPPIMPAFAARFRAPQLLRPRFFPPI